PDIVAPNELDNDISVLLNTPPGGSLSSATVTVNVLNQAPAVSAGDTISYSEHGAPIAISPSATISDAAMANFNGGSLTVALTANGTSADQLTISNQGTGAGQIGISGANVTYGGATIGTFSG